MRVPDLSNDVLTDADALTLAVDVREGLLTGVVPHAVAVERLCCHIIKRRTTMDVTEGKTRPVQVISMGGVRGTFHGWTRVNGDMRAVVETGNGNVAVIEPHHIKFTDRDPPEFDAPRTAPGATGVG